MQSNYSKCVPELFEQALSDFVTHPLLMFEWVWMGAGHIMHSNSESSKECYVEYITKKNQN